MNHSHAFKVIGRQGRDLIFRCPCGEETRRRGTAKELALFGPPLGSSLPVHRVWHAFCRRFVAKGDKWKFTGYAFMKAAEKWALRYPDDVRIVNCDDDFFASSSLVLVEHKTPDAYMGTTVVYIPQCTGEAPIRFFLYPSHRKGLVAALAAIDKGARAPTRAQRVSERQRAKALDKVRP